MDDQDISNELEEAGQSGQSCECVYIGWNNEPRYQAIREALRKAGLNIRVVVYLD